VIGDSGVGVLDWDLGKAAMEALKIPSHAARAHAERYSWKAASSQMYRNFKYIAPCDFVYAVNEWSSARFLDDGDLPSYLPMELQALHSPEHHHRMMACSKTSGSSGSSNSSSTATHPSAMGWWVGEVWPWPPTTTTNYSTSGYGAFSPSSSSSYALPLLPLSAYPSSPMPLLPLFVMLVVVVVMTVMSFFLHYLYPPIAPQSPSSSNSKKRPAITTTAAAFSSP